MDHSRSKSPGNIQAFLTTEGDEADDEAGVPTRGILSGGVGSAPSFGMVLAKNEGNGFSFYFESNLHIIYARSRGIEDLSYLCRGRRGIKGKIAHTE
jgi:hypothetical protein